MNSTSILRLTVAMGLIVMIGGCAGLGKRFQRPEVSLANIRVQEIKLLETAFQVELRVFNTSDIALNVQGIESELYINDKSFARGVTSTEVNIPPFGTELVTIDVYSSALSMVSALFNVMEEGSEGTPSPKELNYSLDGKLHLSGFGLPSTVPFKSEGQLSRGATGDVNSLVPSP